MTEPVAQRVGQRGRRAATRLRVVGAGHSLAPLCATDGTLVRLDGLDGDAAGPVIHLAPDGRSLPNHHLTRLFDLEAPERP
jgi:FAD/FMN-containing dehydrogenase